MEILDAIMHGVWILVVFGMILVLAYLIDERSKD